MQQSFASLCVLTRFSDLLTLAAAGDLRAVKSTVSTPQLNIGCPLAAQQPSSQSPICLLTLGFGRSPGEAHMLCTEQSDPPDQKEDGGDHDPRGQQL